MRHAQNAAMSYKKAFDFESQAAMSLLGEEDKEPTRSILFKSAGWLAIKCDMFNEAERMARHGMLGNPPDEIKMELEEILELSNKNLNQK